MPPVLRVLCSVLGLAVIVAGCSSDDELKPSVAGFADATAISQEYDSATESLDLPDGVRWPSVSFDGDAYSTGYGTQRAYEIWQCQWINAAVYGDEESRGAAMEELTGYLETDQFAKMEAARRDIFEKVITEAADGGRDGMAEFLEASCDGII